jgi:hypothetical protein
MLCGRDMTHPRKLRLPTQVTYVYSSKHRCCGRLISVLCVFSFSIKLLQRLVVVGVRSCSATSMREYLGMRHHARIALSPIAANAHVLGIV